MKSSSYLLQVIMIPTGIKHPVTVSFPFFFFFFNLNAHAALSGDQSTSKAASVGLGIVAGVLIVVGVAAILIAASFYRKLKRLS